MEKRWQEKLRMSGHLLIKGLNKLYRTDRYFLIRLLVGNAIPLVRACSLNLDVSVQSARLNRQ